MPFTVDGTQDVVVVEKHNMPQKGIIHITKTGEVFATVAEMDGVDKDGAEIMYQPVYEIRGLEGATYEIRAAEDIYTPDGTLRAAKRRCSRYHYDRRKRNCFQQGALSGEI